MVPDAYELATSKYEKTMWYYHPATIGSHTTFLMRSSPARSAVNKLHVPSGTGRQVSWHGKRTARRTCGLAFPWMEREIGALPCERSRGVAVDPTCAS